MGLYINMEMPEDSDMIVIYSDGTVRKYLSYTKVIIDEAEAVYRRASWRAAPDGGRRKGGR